MTLIPTQGIAQIVFYVVVLLGLTPLLGHYMARVYEDEHVLLGRFFGFADPGSIACCEGHPKRSRTGSSYGTA